LGEDPLARLLSDVVENLGLGEITAVDELEDRG
jgi:hypothetical protein